ncbi:MAG: histidine kinase, partial [Lachnospiraceae bacterium]|nr:histidine kinase [Lachnospiraceae bacterium]
MVKTNYLLHTKRLVFVLLLLSCLLIPVCKVSAKDNDSDKGFSALLYDNSNGLYTSEANAVAQTSIGFIWIGGYSGLTRYDGSEFHHFDSTTGIFSVNCLYVDSKDRLWVGTNDSGLAVRQNAKFKFWGRNDGLVSLSVRALCEDAAGNIIIATTEGMAYIDQNDKLHMIKDPRIKGKYVRVLKADENGIIYGSTMDSCFFSIENLELTSFYDGEEMGIGEIFCITPDLDEKGKVFLGTESSEIVCGNMMDGMKNLESLSAAPQEHINDIYLAADHKIWICSDNGLGYFDKNRKYVEMKNCPMNRSITSIMEDSEGNLWCASSRQGVMKVFKSPFVDITGISGLDRVVVNTTCIYQEDLYIGTDVGL